jgi:hypothetical protein
MRLLMYSSKIKGKDALNILLGIFKFMIFNILTRQQRETLNKSISHVTENTAYPLQWPIN